MILYLSPSKTMIKDSSLTSPPLFDNSEIITALKNCSFTQFSNMLKASESITHNAYQQLHHPDGLTYRYSGEAFKSLDINSLKTVDDSLIYIGSAYYGLTTLTCAMSFHRLDFNCHLPTLHESLYHYWKPIVTNYLLELNQPIINCASSEYFKLIDHPDLEIIQVDFLDRQKVISSLAKKARGLYARAFLQNPNNYLNIQVLDYHLDNSNPKHLLYSR